MKKFLKALALVLALVLVIGSIPAAAADTAKATKRVLYVGGTKGVDYNGKQSSYKSRVSYYKLLKVNAAVDGVTKKDAKKAKAVSTDPSIVAVNDKSDAARAYGVGTVTITFTMKDGKEYKVEVESRKSAEKVFFGQDWKDLNAGDKFEVEAGKEIIVSVPRTQKDENGEVIYKDTDERRLVVTDAEGNDITASVAVPSAEKPRLWTLTFANAGTYTVTGEAFQSEKSYPAAHTSASITVEVTGSAFNAEATGVKEITVTGFGFSKDTKFEVTKGTAKVDFTLTKVSDDNTTAILTTGNKISSGTYKVKQADTTNEATFTAENETVKALVVKEDGGQALTDKDRQKIYVHYDVLNQYGESVRKSFTVSWTCSYGGAPWKNNTQEGILTFQGPKDNQNKIQQTTYGQQIVLTGVYAKSGVTVTANMTAGLEQHVDTVDVKGVVKVDDKTLSDKVPAPFRENTYAIYFSMKDQNGNDIEYSDAEAQNITITTTAPLTAAVNSQAEKKAIVIDGIEYAYAFVNPGFNASFGGVAPLLIISTKTGGKTNYDLKVDSSQVLKSFTILEYGDIIAEGDTVTLSYEAVDTEGKEVKNFSVLVNSVTLVGDGIRLVENDDGTASLKYTAPQVGATESVDIPQLLMATVIKTGESSNIMPYIKAKRVASAVKGLLTEKVPYVIEDGKIQIFTNGANDWANEGAADGYKREVLRYYDQYEGTLKAVNNADYLLQIEVDNTVISGVAGFWGTASAYVGTTGNKTTYRVDPSGAGAELTIDPVKDVVKTETTTVTFSLYSVSNSSVVAGSEKKITIGIADIGQVKGFALNANKDGDALKNNESLALANVGIGFHVTGTLQNGNTVAIPYTYVKVETPATEINKAATATKASVWADAIGEHADQWANGDVAAKNWWNPLYPADLNDGAAGYNDFTNLSAKNPDGTQPAKAVKVGFSATIYNVVVTGGNIYLNKDAILGTAKYEIEVKAEARKLVKLNHNGWYNPWPITWIEGYGNPITGTMHPTNGTITYADLWAAIAGGIDNYGKGIGLEYTAVAVSEYKEADANYTDGVTDEIKQADGNKYGSYSIAKNNSDGIVISAAERGDKFVATYTGKDANGNAATLVINFTVGADQTAVIIPGNNSPIWY